MSVLVWLGLQLLVLPPSWTRPVLALLFPVLLLARQDRQRVLDLEVGGGCEDGCCDLVVPGERLDAVLVEAAQEAAQPHLLEEALVLLQGSHVVTQSERIGDERSEKRRGKRQCIDTIFLFCASFPPSFSWCRKSWKLHLT